MSFLRLVESNLRNYIATEIWSQYQKVYILLPPNQYRDMLASPEASYMLSRSEDNPHAVTFHGAILVETNSVTQIRIVQ